MFVQEFNDYFYTRFHQDQKRQEYFWLKQFGKIIIEYETKLRELVEFVLELSNFEKYLCSKFKEGLTLKIRENMFISSSQNYKKNRTTRLESRKVD